MLHTITLLLAFASSTLLAQLNAFAAEPAQPSALEIRQVVAAAGDDTEAVEFRPDSTGKTGIPPETLHLKKAAILNADSLKSVTVVSNMFTKMPSVSLVFNEAGTKILAEYTDAHANERVAILVAGKIMVVPLIHTKIAGGTAEISGNFTQDECEAIVAKIQAAIPKGK